MQSLMDLKIIEFFLFIFIFFKPIKNFTRILKYQQAFLQESLIIQVALLKQ